MTKAEKSAVAAVLGSIKTAKKRAASRKNGHLGGRPKWISVKTRLPRQNQRVWAKYAGVYNKRLVTFWKDSVNTHFGEPPVSHPATHWMPVSK